MKRTLKMALIASLAVGGSYVLYGSQNKEELRSEEHTSELQSH